MWVLEITQHEGNTTIYISSEEFKTFAKGFQEWNTYLSEYFYIADIWEENSFNKGFVFWVTFPKFSLKFDLRNE
jgi:hypothetical protein